MMSIKLRKESWQELMHPKAPQCKRTKRLKRGMVWIWGKYGPYFAHDMALIEKFKYLAKMKVDG